MDAQTERFDTLFEACYRPLHAYARRRSSEVDADDVVSESFLIAWRRLNDIPSGGELPWLFGVARRVLANQRRSAGRRAGLVTRLQIRRQRHEYEGSGDECAVLAALVQLSDADQEILRLAAWEQLSTADIAVVLDCTPNAAALRLSRARRKLRTAMTEIDSVRTSPAWKVSDA